MKNKKNAEGLKFSSSQETTNIFIDTFARWKISDPLKFYISVNNEEQAQSRLDGIIDGKIRDAIAPKYIDDIVKNSNGVMTEALNAVQEELENLDIGIEVLGIEIKRMTFNNKIMPQVFDRMASEQEAEAAKFEGQGKAKRSEMLGKIEMQVDSINQSKFIDICALDSKEILIHQIKVSISKRPASAWILIFDFSLNPCILNNIKK